MKTDSKCYISWTCTLGWCRQRTRMAAPTSTHCHWFVFIPSANWNTAHLRQCKLEFKCDHYSETNCSIMKTDWKRYVPWSFFSRTRNNSFFPLYLYSGCRWRRCRWLWRGRSLGRWILTENKIMKYILKIQNALEFSVQDKRYVMNWKYLHSLPCPGSLESFSESLV